MEYKLARVAGDESSVEVIPSKGGLFSQGRGLGAFIGNVIRIYPIEAADAELMLETGELNIGKYISESSERPGVYRFADGVRASISNDHELNGVRSIGSGEEIVETVPPHRTQFVTSGEIHPPLLRSR